MSLGRIITHTRKLNNIGRWANEFLHMRASVAEHSFSVAQIAQMLAFLEESMGGRINWKMLYLKVLNHDMPESITGDVLSSAKNINPETKATILRMERELVDNVLLSTIPAPMDGYYRLALSEGKDATVEGRILNAADDIDALMECLQEVKLANTEPFAQKYHEILKKIEASTLQSVRYFLYNVLPQLVGSFKL